MKKSLLVLLFTLISLDALADSLKSKIILSLELPIRVYGIESKYGLPSNIEVPDQEDPSPWGQWFEWKIKSSGLVLTALADDYSQTPNHETTVRLLKIKPLNLKSKIDTVYGYTLNKTTIGTIQREHTKTIKKNHWSVYYFEDGIWTYYKFNGKGIITEVHQSTFDEAIAD